MESVLSGARPLSSMRQSCNCASRGAGRSHLDAISLQPEEGQFWLGRLGAPAVGRGVFLYRWAATEETARGGGRPQKRPRR